MTGKLDRGTAQARQRMEDVTYSLCVTTGTQDVDGTLAAARQQPRSPAR
nr:DUF5133 domain-containing protein [Streptomyces viridochromogenes]